MPKFRKKPVVIDAEQFDGTPESGAVIVAWARSHGVQEVEFHPFLAGHFKGDPRGYVAHPDPFMRIKTLEGTMVASKGSWVIRGVKGEFYPCKPDIFADTYESVTAIDVAELQAIERATFPEMFIINGGRPVRIGEYLPVSCECGSVAVPMLSYIGNETIMRLVKCVRCGAELGKLVLPRDLEEIETTDGTETERGSNE